MASLPVAGSAGLSSWVRGVGEQGGDGAGCVGCEGGADGDLVVVVVAEGKAVRQLREEGLVRTTPGWGTYVIKKNDDANP